MSIKDFFGIDIATEKNDYIEEDDDKVYIRNDKGELILLEGIENDDN